MVMVIYQIQKVYVMVYSLDHTDEAVNNLAAILLKDFDDRCVPANGPGRSMSPTRQVSTSTTATRAFALASLLILSWTLRHGIS